MPPNEAYELLETIDDDLRGFMEAHQARRADWYFHDLIPWELGENFREKPWEPSQATLSEVARTSLILNLLTEDNLPYYHNALERFAKPDTAFAEWTRRWTAEEDQHAIAIRSYLLTSRNCDPNALEDDRMATMSTGYYPDFRDPAEVFAYTSAQELATRISHRNTGRLTDDPTAFELMRMIASDENHHFIFYRDAMTAMLRNAPSVALPAILRVFDNFQMPGVGMPNFLRRSVDVARAGVYNLRIHHDGVIVPLLRHWGISDLKDLTPAAAEVQEKLMALPAKLLRRAEIVEKRLGINPA